MSSNFRKADSSRIRFNINFRRDVCEDFERPEDFVFSLQTALYDTVKGILYLSRKMCSMGRDFKMYIEGSQNVGFSYGQACSQLSNFFIQLMLKSSCSPYEMGFSTDPLDYCFRTPWDCVGMENVFLKPGEQFRFDYVRDFLGCFQPVCSSEGGKAYAEGVVVEWCDLVNTKFGFVPRRLLKHYNGLEIFVETQMFVEEIVSVGLVLNNLICVADISPEADVLVEENVITVEKSGECFQVFEAIQISIEIGEVVNEGFVLGIEIPPGVDFDQHLVEENVLIGYDLDSVSSEVCSDVTVQNRFILGLSQDEILQGIIGDNYDDMILNISDLCFRSPEYYGLQPLPFNYALWHARYDDTRINDLGPDRIPKIVYPLVCELEFNLVDNSLSNVGIPLNLRHFCGLCVEGKNECGWVLFCRKRQIIVKHVFLDCDRMFGCICLDVRNRVITTPLKLYFNSGLMKMAVPYNTRNFDCETQIEIGLDTLRCFSIKFRRKSAFAVRKFDFVRGFVDCALPMLYHCTLVGYFGLGRFFFLAKCEMEDKVLNVETSSFVLSSFIHFNQRYYLGVGYNESVYSSYVRDFYEFRQLTYEMEIYPDDCSLLDVLVWLLGDYT